MFKILSCLSLCLICQSALAAKACDTVESLTWLVGSWSSQNSKYIINESWQRTSAKTFEGSGSTFSVEKNRIVSSETLRLVEMSGEVFYVAKVASNELPIAFKLTHCTANTAVFENSKHDFPKKLNYQMNTDKSVTVFISGDEGKGFSIDFLAEDNRNE